jgi:hypothetical protein
MAPIFDPPGISDDDTPGDTLQRQILREQLSRVAEEKRLALQDPGPSWGEWFYYDAAKWWVILGFLIVDAWVVVACFGSAVPLITLPAVVGALYVEFLTYRYLWYVPDADSPRIRRKFRPSWVRLVRYGRWTPEAAFAKASPAAADAEAGPQPDEFL